MRKLRWIFLSTLLLPAVAVIVKAQPLPCGPKPDMTINCIDACVICDIDGYTGINDDPQRGQAPPGFCTTTVHHMQWIAFIAGSTDLTITVTPSGCRLGNGLEVGIYESLDCNNFKLVSNCNGDIAPGQTGVFTNVQPLVVGKYYYFVMDGNNGDVCNYLIRVTKGSTKVPPLPPTKAIAGPAEVCQGDTMVYSVPVTVGANFYQWRLDGQLVAEGINPKIAFPDAGTHQLCVTAFNVCDTADASCMTVQVHEDKTTRLVEEICEGECVTIIDTTICDPGNYTFRLKTARGCDSTVLVSVSRIATVSVELSAAICSTDSLFVGDSWYRPPGKYVEVQTSLRGCDSLINLTLQAIICEITGRTSVQPVVCHGGRTGAFTFSVLDGTPPFTYTWERLGGGPSGSGNLAALNVDTRFGNLPAGAYLVTIRDNYGNDAVLTAAITEPPPLRINLERTDFHGFHVACHGGRNGTITALPMGGTPPYAYQWDNGERQAIASGLPEGAYALTVTDVANCVSTARTTLEEPPQLVLTAQFSDPNCDGYNTGTIVVQTASGGVAPYRFSLASGSFTDKTTFSSLREGIYTVRVKDANGCTIDSTAALTAAAIPTLTLGGDYELQLGHSIQLEAFVDLIPKTIQWTPAEGLSCADCLEPVATPLKTTVYTLTVNSNDDCPATDSLTVKVLNFQKIYAPNAFSPNNDGINDYFSLFTDLAVRQIKHLQVFSRWGELIFERSNFPANEPSLGWDGRYRGKALDAGVYAWWAEVEFLDGKSLVVKGEVAIVQ